ncbi:MAG: sensor domain-containing diguanylate cyclase [Actinomycetota bacterium]|nr:sensor domain-containing diguanylate cyclase [Actinomycetota bacterium]
MSDSFGWAIFAAVVVLLGLVFLLVFIRERRAADQRFMLAMQELATRMDGMVRELQTSFDRSHVEEQRRRVLGELGGSIDLDEVLTRVLEAAGAIRGVDAALVTLDSGGGEKPIVATVGLSTEEAERQAVAGPPDGREARAMSISYEYPTGAEIDDGELIRHGIAVPIPGETGAIGFMSVFSRSATHEFGDDDKRALEDLADRAGPAIENARRFREARQLADLDALTGLHNRRYFHETLAREVARAHRYERRLALVVFDLDDFKAINDRIGHLAGDAVLAEVAERVRSVVRSADIACRVGGDEFGIILPESTLTDAEQLSRRMQQAVAARPIGDVGKLGLSAGAAELRADDDSEKFFKRADDALYQAKESGKAEVVAATGDDARGENAAAPRAAEPTA